MMAMMAMDSGESLNGYHVGWCIGTSPHIGRHTAVYGTAAAAVAAAAAAAAAATAQLNDVACSRRENQTSESLVDHNSLAAAVHG